MLFYDLWIQDQVQIRSIHISITEYQVLPRGGKSRGYSSFACSSFS